MGAALLRMHNVAATLSTWGWDVHVLPHTLTLSQRQRCLAALSPDLIIMQGTRHPLNRPGLYPGRKIVMDLDDGDFHLPHLAASVRDAVPKVAAVMAGSQYIADWCKSAGAARAHVVWTGASVSEKQAPPQAGRPPVVAWAQTRPMDYTHEAALVRDVMRQIGASCPGTVLRLYDRCAGDDKAFARSFEAPGLSVEWCERARYRDYLASFDDVAVGLAPMLMDDPFCRGKSFGKVLAYLDRGVPVVASDAGEPSAFFGGGAGCLCQAQDDWVHHITRLLQDSAARQTQAVAGFQGFQKQLSVTATTDAVADVLKMVIAGQSQAATAH